MTDRGVIGDGSTLNTAAINKAVDEIAQGAGGTLVFPAGCYLTGTIYLKSGVKLRLEKDATILGSPNLVDYPENQPPRPSKTLEFGRYSLIYADRQRDVGIEGVGTIDGQGDNPNFVKKDLKALGWNARDVYLKRPFGICFAGCKGVSVRGVHLRNAGFWMEDYLDCDQVNVDGILVQNLNDDANNDGIDVDGSQNVTITNSEFEAADDGICLKSSYSQCRNVHISHCKIQSTCNGIKLGTASYAGFSKIYASDCLIHDTYLAGIALEIVDGGRMDGVTVNRVRMDGIGAPIFMRIGDLGRRWLTEQVKQSPGSIRNISISNIDATVNQGPDSRPMACSITGLPGHDVENTDIRNVRIDDRRVPYSSKRRTFDDVQELPRAYPEYSMFGALPACGFFLRHLTGVSLTDVSIQESDSENRYTVAIDDANRILLDRFSILGSKSISQSIAIRNIHTAELSVRHLPDMGPEIIEDDGGNSNIKIKSPKL